MSETDSLVGRADEWARLSPALAAVRRGEGRAFLVVGEAGIGKTHFVRALLEEARDQGFQILEGQAFPLDGGLPYAPVAEAVATQLKHISNGQQARLVDGLTAIRAFLGAAQSAGAPGAPEGPVEKHRFFAEVEELIRRMAKEAPLALFVDDLHWTDTATHELVYYLVRNLRDQPVLFAATIRRHELMEQSSLRALRQSFQRGEFGEILELKPLGCDERFEFAKTRLGGTPSRELFEVVSERSAGYPLYLEMLLRSLLEQKRLRRFGSVWDFRDSPELALSSSLRAFILDQFHHLPDAHQKLLRLLAVAGRSVDGLVLRSVWPLDESALLSALTDLAAARIVVETPTATGLTYRFAHPLYQEVVYGELTEIVRRTLHARFAAVLETQGQASDDVIARHYSRALGYVDASRALDVLVRAGERARRVHAYAEAAQYLRTALSLARETHQAERLLPILESLGEACEYAGEGEEAASLYQEALGMRSERGDDAGTARLYYHLARVYAYQGALSKAHDDLEKAQAILSADPGGSKNILADVYNNLFRSYWRLGEQQKAKETAAALQSLAHAADQATVARARLAAAVCHSWRGEWSAVLPECGRALAAAKECDDVEMIGAIHDHTALFCVYMGYPKRALEHVRASETLGRRIGRAAMLAHARENRIAAEILTGDFVAALRTSEEAIAAATRHGAKRHLGSAWLMRSYVLTYMGDFERAVASFEKAAETLPPPGCDQNKDQTRNLVALTLALRRGERCDGLLRDVQVRYPAIPLLQILGEAQLSAGQRDACQETLAVLNNHGRLGNPYAQAAGKRLSALIRAEEGDRAAAEKRFQEAAELFDALQIPYWAARTRGDLAVRIVEADPNRACSILKACLAAFEKMGAAADAKAVRDQLSDLGVRPDSWGGRDPAARFEQAASPPPERAPEPAGDSQPGDDQQTLSPREVEVARLVAQGYTNKQIAERLFISHRTVETHLHRIYRRLDLANRAELSRYVSESGFLHRASIT